MQTDPNAAADAKAKIKRSIREQLATLPVQARADVLADLRLELALGATANAVEDFLNGGPRRPLSRGTHRRPAKGGTRPHKPRGSGPTAVVYGALKAHPRMPIGELMKVAYPGDTSGTTHKVRAILFSLKRQNKVRNVGHGQWEVVEG